MSAKTESNEQPNDLHPLIQQRIANREALRQAGQDPYGSGEPGLISLAAAHDRYDEAADEDQKANGKSEGFVDKRPVVTVAGRVMLSRDNGKLIWLNLRDDSGDLQIAVSQRDCDESGFAAAKLLDNADVVVATGPLVKTRTGERTVWASSLRVASKSLVPPPEKWAGLQDVEARYRKRYVDLWANPEAMRVFQLRSKIVAGIRKLMDARGFIEVETPMLQAQAGGAAARPFVTHMNALDIDLSMRIAPELYLKRLLVGGMRKVYEINRNFRNEGVDKQHNPEFTAIEAYEAFGNYHSVMELTEDIIRESAKIVCNEMDVNPLRSARYAGGKFQGRSIGEVWDQYRDFIVDGLRNINSTDFQATMGPDVLSTFNFLLTKIDINRLGSDTKVFKSKTHTPPSELSKLEPLLAQTRRSNTYPLTINYGDLEINYARPFARVTYAELFERALGFPTSDVARAREAARKHHIKTVAEDGSSMDDVWVVNELFEEVAERAIDPSVPTWVMDYPAALSPLTRPKSDDPSIAERADLFVAGMEVGPHYTELNDPDIQLERFREQLSGIDDEESTFRTLDEDFVEALRVGMPPAGGMGLGIDRLVMLVTNSQTIRDVILFPQLRSAE